MLAKFSLNSCSLFTTVVWIKEWQHVLYPCIWVRALGWSIIFIMIVEREWEVFPLTEQKTSCCVWTLSYIHVRYRIWKTHMSGSMRIVSAYNFIEMYEIDTLGWFPGENILLSQWWYSKTKPTIDKIRLLLFGWIALKWFYRI